ncbi:MAG: hypothetical protein A3J65_00185 [Candidatus Buchananbacteria bacterium RIFCSPHIGHO2_02_FULL_45_11b]|uniref:Putative 3-methyladenine DNA glycosylase n=3 Tax=Candidatus Buchananiibacteriota TaxID=1817903 RepID=A0A1G1YFT7_9BACT|nr:MAG: hypothetical protein A2663_00140 [Candidatus Buchananbacteria bacterium RIFCSPHIGHO2_01_FULL_46_12]OGY50347.1 MAG: hypothetical protein A3J65_00185 [Candidatus Buchananbacteria bacterium RIFCSPHIGHO2_02_FULL_45_11b]OGY57480.1 MAG: hypothetical protein A3H67_02415 [Candidatus Buchananbacteria bacterium RIFCSPLOWO2_02_FULL_46_11b]
MKLPQSFYSQDTLKVAQNLLGKFLARKIGGKTIVGQITETEAYCGPNDLASHASRGPLRSREARRGKTPRTELMFGQPGFWYIYLIYGMYYCLNVVTEKNEYPAAVLIRGVKPIAGLKPEVKTDGPGKLCRAFKIDKTLNGSPASGPKAEMWIEDRGVKINPSQIKKAPRVGVDYAGAYKSRPWRFFIQ